MSGAGRAFLLVWALCFVAVMALAWRQLGILMKMADDPSAEAKELRDRTVRWAYRYALSVMGLGVVMALAAPWI